MEPGSKWRRNPSDVSDALTKHVRQEEPRHLTDWLSWRRGMTAQVGITMPRTKPAAPTGTLKTPGTGESEACNCLACALVSFKTGKAVALAGLDVFKSL